MKITCSVKKLNKALQILQKAFPARSISQIYTGIYIKAAEGQIQMQATDSNVGIEVIVEASVDEEGIAVIPGVLFSSIISRIEKENVEVHKAENKVIITSGSYSTTIFSMPAEDYPVLKKTPAVGNFIKINNDVLKELIKKTIFACATSKERAVFTGVLVEIKNKEVSFIATNTHRLIWKKQEIAADGGDFSMIIPSSVLRDIESINIDDPAQVVSIGWKSQQITVRFADVYLEARLIDGKFPDYQRVVPKSFGKEVKVKTSEFLGAVGRAAPFFKEGESNVLKLNIDNGKMTITVNKPETGKSEETIECENSGGTVDIAFDLRYISDILKRIDSVNTIIQFNSSVEAACIKQENDDSYLYVVTPVRMQY